eukprot:g3498.t1
MTDLFLSEVHIDHCPPGRGTWTSRIRLLSNKEVSLDEDGDLCLDDLFWTVKHQRETPLEHIGSQIWRGCCLLTDYILANQNLFKGKIIFELGCGVGIIGLALSNLAEEVYLTDHDINALELCRENLNRNSSPSNTVFKIRKLDWTENSNLVGELETTKETEEECFGWKEGDINVLNSVDLFLAADVVYDDLLTDDFLRKLETLMKVSKKDPVCFVALEKRWNFTMDALDVVAPAYDHFINYITNNTALQNQSRCFTGERITIDKLPKSLDVERSADQELWKLKLKTSFNKLSFS